MQAAVWLAPLPHHSWKSLPEGALYGGCFWLSPALQSPVFYHSTLQSNMNCPHTELGPVFGEGTQGWLRKVLFIRIFRLARDTPKLVNHKR